MIIISCSKNNSQKNIELSKTIIENEENQFKVSLPDKYIIFEIKYFASQEDFDEFRSLFN